MSKSFNQNNNVNYEQHELTVLGKAIKMYKDEYNNVWWVPIRPICEILGMSAYRQGKKLSEDKSYVTQRMLAHDSSGRLQEHIALEHKYVWPWVMGISTAKVNESSQELLLAFKHEINDAIHNYITQGFALNSDFIAQHPELRQLLVDALNKLEEQADRGSLRRKIGYYTINEFIQTQDPKTQDIIKSFKGFSKVLGKSCTAVCAENDIEVLLNADGSVFKGVKAYPLDVISSVYKTMLN